MEQEYLNNIGIVIGRLNTLTVSGEQNLTTLLGSIGVLKDVYTAMAAKMSEAKEE